MTEYSTEKVTELVGESDRLLAENQWTSGWGVESLADRLTDALEAVANERDEALAVIAEASEWAENVLSMGDALTLRGILSRITDKEKS